MRELIPRQLWLGNAMDARDLRRVHDAGICAIVDCAFEEIPLQVTRDLIYCRFPLVDGGGNSPSMLSAAISQTAFLIRRQVPTLVSCGAGISRSPSIVAAALAIIGSRSPDDCLCDLLADHPHDVSPLLWADVKTAYSEIVDQ